MNTAHLACIPGGPTSTRMHCCSAHRARLPELESHLYQRTHADFHHVSGLPCAQVLDQQDLAGALRCLRADIAPLGVEPALVHRLAACLMCSSPGELHTFSGWAGGVAETRAAVLRSLQART